MLHVNTLGANQYHIIDRKNHLHVFQSYETTVCVVDTANLNVYVNTDYRHSRTTNKYLALFSAEVWFEDFAIDMTKVIKEINVDETVGIGDDCTWRVYGETENFYHF